MLEIAVIQFIAGIQMMMKALNFSKVAQLWNYIKENSFGVIEQFAGRTGEPSGVMGLVGIGLVVLSVVSLIGAMCSSKVLKRISLVLTFGVLLFSAIYWGADLDVWLREQIEIIKASFNWLVSIFSAG